jgi:hypothetical protein
MAVGRRTGGYAFAYLTGGTVATLTPTSAPQPGDTIIVFALQLGDATAFTLPSGFLKEGTTLSDGITSIQVFKKRAAAGEPSSYAFTSNAGFYGPVVMHTYTGAADIGPIASWASEPEAAGTAVTWPNIPVPVAGGAALVAATTNSSATFTTPAGWTPGYDTGRGKTFDILAPSVGTLTGPASTASISEPHLLLSLFITPTLQPPTNIAAPRLTGNNWNGQSLSLNMGDWLGVDEYDYVVWKRDGVAF